MIEIKEGRYFSQWWFLCSNGSKFDVLGALYRDDGETVWHLHFRFRIYDGTNRSPWEDQDEKKWFHAELPGAEEAALDIAHRSFKEIADQTKLDIHIIPTRTADTHKITDALNREKWAHPLPAGTSSLGNDDGT